MSSEPPVSNPASKPTSTPLPPSTLPAKQKTARKEKKPVASDSRPDTTAKFPWHKYPDATQHLCSIKDRLLERGRDGKRVRGMGKLKEQTRDELLEWWDDHTKEGRNKGDMHELIHNFYKNRLQLNDWDKYDGSSNVNSTTQAPATATQPTRRDSDSKTAMLDGVLAPLLQAFRGRARGASTIWAEANPAEVEKVKQTLPRHPGVHKRAVGIGFDQLSADKKAHWQDKADEEKTAIENDLDACFNNQTEFPNVLAAFLDCLIGHGPKQIGSALIDYQLAMRLKDGRVKLHRCTVGLEEGDEPFAEFQGGPSQEENHRWRDFVDLKLAHNPIPRDERFTYGDDGMPKLPPYDRTWSTEVAAEVLQAWFELVWDYAREHGEQTLPQALDWELVTKDEAAFVPPVWRNHGIRDPNEIEFFNMAVIYHRLYEAQDGTAPFHWQSSKGPARELPVPPSTIPVTPRRNTRVVFSSPTKVGTPYRPSPQCTPIRPLHFGPESAANISAPIPALNVPTTLSGASTPTITESEVSVDVGTDVRTTMRTTAKAVTTTSSADLDGPDLSDNHVSGTTTTETDTSLDVDTVVVTTMTAVTIATASAMPSSPLPAPTVTTSTTPSSPLPALTDAGCLDDERVVSNAVTAVTAATASAPPSSPLPVIANASIPSAAKAEAALDAPTTPSYSTQDLLEDPQGYHTDCAVDSSAPAERGGAIDESVAPVGAISGLVTVAKKRGPSSDGGGEEELPAKRTRRKSAGSELATQTEPIRRSSRVRTGAAASVSYRVLDGGKDTSASTGANRKKGGQGKKGPGGK
ncbi:hypothetical protein GSI_14948 [Ganoderma sinense ZZ0214-1]|uniref:Uncharacterized protein n=1 Tax=Ganoderma sinense ZZ0214-1 TaxID=1077348 RepID=A0A2G8RQ39_9APHY|nr:hypothetical protein GSI_14948 [Ganoderma sinense ZZ0214-1]